MGKKKGNKGGNKTPKKGTPEKAAAPAAEPKEEPKEEPKKEEPKKEAPKEEPKKEEPKKEEPKKKKKANQPPAETPKAQPAGPVDPQDSIAVKYDVTKMMAPFLDCHLLIPLLEFLSNLEPSVYEADSLLERKIDVVSKTNMVDFVLDCYNRLGKEPPAEVRAKRDTVIQSLTSLKAAAGPLLDVIEDDALTEQLMADNMLNMGHLMTVDENISAETLDALYAFAKCKFDAGFYKDSAEYLYFYRALSNDDDKTFSALWGKFAADILNLDWDTAYTDMTRLKETIDNKLFAKPVVQLQQRVWLIHWSLFVFFNHKDGRNGIIDMFFDPKYINTIQTACPWILRYLTTAIITNKRRRNVLQDLVNVIQQERYTYRDPITEFVECLYVNFDFEGAQQKLLECGEVLANDFFLVACREDFIDNARLFIFETYCRIHQCIDIKMLASKLNMDEKAAERWIVNLIRNARLDAKIDSKANHIIMGAQYPSVYQQVIQKTNNLSAQSYMLHSAARLAENSQ